MKQKETKDQENQERIIDKMSEISKKYLEDFRQKVLILGL